MLRGLREWLAKRVSDLKGRALPRDGALIYLLEIALFALEDWFYIEVETVILNEI